MLRLYGYSDTNGNLVFECPNRGLTTKGYWFYNSASGNPLHSIPDAEKTVTGGTDIYQKI